MEQQKTELQRIERLRNYRIIDTPQEEEYDYITKMAAHICKTPISLITLIDMNRQWFKSSEGVGELKETPREISFCEHTIQQENDYMVVNDLSKDERFVANPFVVGAPYVKFYAGVSLKTSDGFKLGTVCVFDDKPRTLTEEQLESLKLLSRYAMKLMELRSQNFELQAIQKTLENTNKDLRQYAHAVAHDIKSPLRIMNSFVSLLMRGSKDKFNEREQEFMNFIGNAAKELSNYTRELLTFTENAQIDVKHCTIVDLVQLVDGLNNLLTKNTGVEVIYNKDAPPIFVSEVGLKQILHNLISNSIRYRNPESPAPFVKVKMTEDEHYYKFSVKDNGQGISKKRMKNIFGLFKKDPAKAESTGLGLNLVKRLIEKMDGTIEVKSKIGKGTTIKFTIKKIISN